jgi:hypothetical protein
MSLQRHRSESDANTAFDSSSSSSSSHPHGYHHPHAASTDSYSDHHSSPHGWPGGAGTGSGSSDPYLHYSPHALMFSHSASSAPSDSPPNQQSPQQGQQQQGQSQQALLSPELIHDRATAALHEAQSFLRLMQQQLKTRGDDHVSPEALSRQVCAKCLSGQQIGPSQIQFVSNIFHDELCVAARSHFAHTH